MKFNELPEFKRLPLEPPKMPHEKELFYPQWKCFCCHDSGLVSRQLVLKIIPKYSYDEDRWPACQNLKCESFKKRFGENIPDNNFDMRFTPGLCQKLDLIERENWRLTVEKQVEIRREAAEKIKSVSQSLRMKGSSDRTENDHREIQQRKQEIENVSHEQWLVMARNYLGELES